MARRRKTEEEYQEESSWGSISHLIAGTAAGLIATAILYPLDLMKVRYQAQHKSVAPYRSLAKGIRTVIRQEGWRAMFRGMSPALMGSGVSWGGYFYCYENAKKRYRSQMSSSSNQQLLASHHLLAATEAGVILVFLTNPVWLIKTRLQLQIQRGGVAASHHYNGPLDAFWTILRDEGLPGLYRGLTPALSLVGHGALQFMAYEWLKKEAQKWRTKSKETNTTTVDIIQQLTVGSTAKIFASVITYPAQVIKTRLQLRGSKKEGYIGQKRYKGTLDCIIKIAKEEGPGGFFKGCVPNALRVAPSAAITFLVYEQSIKLLKGRNHQRKTE